MAEYIDKENALLQLTGRFPHSMSLEKYIGLVNFRINGLPTADVVEREKIDKAIEEMDKLASHKVKPISFDQAVAIDMCIEILKRNIGE